MKNNEIQQLLDRYRQGSLDDNGLAELNRLAHRDEVMAEAGQRASAIVHRRAALFTVAGLLLAGTAVLMLPRQEERLVAEAVVPEVVMPTEPKPVVEQAVPVKVVERKPAAKPLPRRTATLPAAATDDDPIVVCNNQCEADSVINDIWKFLTV